jgi:hypothetical protein
MAVAFRSAFWLLIFVWLIAVIKLGPMVSSINTEPTGLMYVLKHDLETKKRSLIYNRSHATFLFFLILSLQWQGPYRQWLVPRARLAMARSGHVA